MDCQDESQDERATASVTVTRGTQTILTSRGSLSLASQSQSLGERDDLATLVIPNDRTSERARTNRLVENKSVTTQVISPQPASLIRSENSTSLATARNEIITVTTDYENRSSADGCSSWRVQPRNIENAVAESRREGPRHRLSPPPTILFGRRRRWGRWSRWTLPCCTARAARVDVNFEYAIGTSDAEERRSAPPSYSILFPPRRMRDLAVQLTDGSSSSFVAPTPPPSYAQAQGICVAFSLEQLVSNSASHGRILSPRSTAAVCPRCATLVVTVVEMHRATATHIAAFALFLMGCWPCCILPYCMDSCKTSHHYCPYCRTYLGTYNPW